MDIEHEINELKKCFDLVMGVASANFAVIRLMHKRLVVTDPAYAQLVKRGGVRLHDEALFYALNEDAVTAYQQTVASIFRLPKPKASS